MGEEPSAVERRMTGEAYSDGIVRLRRILPRDVSYGLVTTGPEVEGVGNWVRFDLAPRRAVFLGTLRSLPGPARMARGARGGQGGRGWWGMGGRSGSEGAMKRPGTE